jgi:hypothetical protein
MPAQLVFKSANPDEPAAAVVSQLQKLDGVLSVARNNTIEGVEGFVSFENPELAAAARNNRPADALYVLEDPAREPVRRERKQTSAASAGASKRGKGAAHGGQPFTADFFNGPSPSTMRAEPVRGGGRGGGRGGSRGGGRGGDESNGRARNGGRGGNGDGPRRPPLIKAHAVCVHNVPVNVTNDQIFQAFKQTGHIFDIRRMERLALLLMRDAESVVEAIVAMNGKQLGGVNVVVCGGGEMRMPVPPPPPGADGPVHHSPLHVPPHMAPPALPPA